MIDFGRVQQMMRGANQMGQRDSLDWWRNTLVGHSPDQSMIRDVYNSFAGRHPTEYELDYYGDRTRGDQLFENFVVPRFGQGPVQNPTQAWFGPSGPSPIPEGSPINFPGGGSQHPIANMVPSNPAQPSPGSFMAQAMKLSGVPGPGLLQYDVPQSRGLLG